MCHSNKLESVFEYEVSRLLYVEGEVEYCMYEPVDLTEESATKAATGSTMQGDEIGRVFLPFTSSHPPLSDRALRTPKAYTRALRGHTS